MFLWRCLNWYDNFKARGMFRLFLAPSIYFVSFSSNYLPSNVLFIFLFPFPSFLLLSLSPAPTIFISLFLDSSSYPPSILPHGYQLRRWPTVRHSRSLIVAWFACRNPVTLTFVNNAPTSSAGVAWRRRIAPDPVLVPIAAVSSIWTPTSACLGSATIWRPYGVWRPG